MQAGERTFLEEGFLLWKAASDMYPIGLQQGDSNMEVNDAKVDAGVPHRGAYMSDTPLLGESRRIRVESGTSCVLYAEVEHKTSTLANISMQNTQNMPLFSNLVCLVVWFVRLATFSLAWLLSRHSTGAICTFQIEAGM